LKADDIFTVHSDMFNKNKDQYCRTWSENS